jgi:threonine dehydratase
VVCVPHGNNPERNAAIRGYDAGLVEEGRDYDESVEVALRIARERGMRLVHSTNDPLVIAGAGTIALEMLEQEPSIEALVVAVGGGSQAVGALTVTRALRPDVRVYAVQAERASAIRDSWAAGERRPRPSADTFADGLATRNAYDASRSAARGTRGVRARQRGGDRRGNPRLSAHDPQPRRGGRRGGLAGLFLLRDELAGKRVGIILSGANIDFATLRRVVNREL